MHFTCQMNFLPRVRHIKRLYLTWNNYNRHLVSHFLVYVTYPYLHYNFVLMSIKWRINATNCCIIEAHTSSNWTILVHAQSSPTQHARIPSMASLCTSLYNYYIVLNCIYPKHPSPVKLAWSPHVAHSHNVLVRHCMCCVAPVALWQD